MTNVEKYELELVKKSNEAFKMALEIINKPTIQYRTEGFLMYICNAWELIFKARIVGRENRIEAINYNDKNKSRSFSLEKCINVLHARENDFIKTSLSFLIQLRNTATHLFIPEYDYDFSQAFQNSVVYYYDYCMQYYEDKQTISTITPYISIVSVPSNGVQNALVLNKDPSNAFKTKINKDINNAIMHRFEITKSKNADFTVKINKEADASINIVEKPVDINRKYCYSQKDIINEVKKRLNEFGKIHFTTYSFMLLDKKKNIKKNTRYAYGFELPSKDKSFSYKYCFEVIDFIYTQLVNKGSLAQLYYDILPKTKKN